MSTVAEALRCAREAAGLSLHQMADALKMRADHLAALERGDYSVFAAPVYIRGFVRGCSRLLRLDEAEMMARLEAELGRTEKFREHPSLTGEQRGTLDRVMLQLSRVNWRVALPTVAALLVLLGAGWIASLWQARLAQDPVADLEPARFQDAGLVSGDVLPLPAQVAPAR